MKKRFITAILIIMLGLLVAESLNQQKVYGEYEIKIYDINAHVLSFYLNYIETVLERIDAVTLSIIGDQNLHDELSFINECYQKEGYSANLREANSRIRKYFTEEPYFKYFILKTEKYRFSYGGVLATDDEIEEYIAVCDDKGGALQRIYKNGQMILVREIRKPSGNEYRSLGHILAFVDFDKIVEDMETAFPNDDQKLNVAIHHEDICLYTNKTDMPVFSGRADGWWIENGHFTVKKTYAQLGYTVLLQTDYSEVQNQLDRTSRRAVGIFASMTLIAVLLCVQLIRSVTVELENIVRLMDNYGHGEELQLDSSEKAANRKDEIGRLYRHFFKMAKDYKRLSESYYENKLLLKEMEFSWLQKQIQPHLLYNTLSAIEWTAYSNKDTETAQMIQLLGRLMRRVTDVREPMITVESELKIVNDYVQIQKLRVGNRLDVQVDISQRTRQLLVPKMSVQPLVENCIIHGMEKTLDSFSIRIWEKETPDTVELIIEDNGPGCSDRILEEIDTVEKKNMGDGVALKNIHKRLQYAYSSEAGLRFERIPEGMRVSFGIPLRKEKEER